MKKIGDHPKPELKLRFCMAKKRGFGGKALVANNIPLMSYR
jgi:hypothetical protein